MRKLVLCVCVLVCCGGCCLLECPREEPQEEPQESRAIDYDQAMAAWQASQRAQREDALGLSH